MVGENEDGPVLISLVSLFLNRVENTLAALTHLSAHTLYVN